MGAITVSRPSAQLRLVPLQLLSDERLAQLAGGGDADAFATLYERYRVPLSRYCRSIVHDGEDARDALQSTMAAALDAIQTRVPSGRVRPWLYRIAHNESVSVLRRRKPHEQLNEEIPAPAREGLARERWQAVIADLRMLPERQRGALVMRELGGLRYAEIGAALEMSSVAARKAVYEARVGLTKLAVGRDSPCEEIRVRISDGDRRALRARRVRGHIEDCAACAAFERGLRERRRELALIPVLPGVSTGALLAGGIGGGSVGSALAIKGVALGSVFALAGAGAIVGVGLKAAAPGHPRARAHAAVDRPSYRLPGATAATRLPITALPAHAAARGPAPLRVVLRSAAPGGSPSERQHRSHGPSAASLPLPALPPTSSPGPVPASPGPAANSPSPLPTSPSPAPSSAGPVASNQPAPAPTPASTTPTEPAATQPVGSSSAGPQFAMASSDPSAWLAAIQRAVQTALATGAEAAVQQAQTLIARAQAAIGQFQGQPSRAITAAQNLLLSFLQGRR
jgi:RNA polymerase sigma factor (sigma-70 family)